MICLASPHLEGCDFHAQNIDFREERFQKDLNLAFFFHWDLQMSGKKILSFHHNNFYGRVGKFQTWSQFDFMDMAAYHSVIFIFKVLEDVEK